MGKPFDVILAKDTDVTYSFQVWLYWPKLSIFTCIFLLVIRMQSLGLGLWSHTSLPTLHHFTWRNLMLDYPTLQLTSCFLR